MISVLFVCLGNICRSPVAEGIFKKLVKEKGLEDKIICDSAGTSSFHNGNSPDPRSTANAKKNGILLNHRSRQFTEKDAEDFRYILAMDNSNFSNTQELLSQKEGKDGQRYMMRDFDPNAKGADVPDPYYGAGDGFQEVFEILDRSCTVFLDFLIEEHGLDKIS